MRTYLTQAGGSYAQGREAAAPDLTVGISQLPTDAIGVLCHPAMVRIEGGREGGREGRKKEGWGGVGWWPLT